MTPDMKRLCDAAQDDVDQAVIDGGMGREPSIEPIVRAVLMELREPSLSMREAGEVALLDAYEYGSDENGEGNLVDVRTIKDGTESDVLKSMIDAILAEPATA